MKEYIELHEGDIPGMIERDGDLWMPVAGEYFRVTGVYRTRYGLVPLLDMPTVDMPQRKERDP